MCASSITQGFWSRSLKFLSSVIKRIHQATKRIRFDGRKIFNHFLRQIGNVIWHVHVRCVDAQQYTSEDKEI